MNKGSNPRHIGDLVLETIRRAHGRISYELMAAEVKKHFPHSKWNEHSWSTYRSHITGPHGKYRNQFSDEIRENLIAANPRGTRSGPARSSTTSIRQAEGAIVAKIPEEKRLGDALLNHVRFVIAESTRGDPDLHFRVNRWIFQRLHQDEIGTKRPIKRQMWESGITSCQGCGKPFTTLKGVEIHRKDRSKAYSVENCELVCRPCHREKDGNPIRPGAVRTDPRTEPAS